MRRRARIAASLVAVAAAAGLAAACSRVRIPPSPGVATRARSLPLRELPVPGDTGRVFAIVLTGDGPTGGLGKRIGRELQGEGIPSVVWHSLRYYWRPKTPDQAARDLDLAIRHYARRWGRDRVLLVGYSMGADVLPFQINRLPPETRARIAGVALIALAHDAVFEFRVEQWWGTSGAPSRATRPEIERLGDLRVLCIWGEGDDKAACPRMRTAPMQEVRLRGGHHFKGDEKRLMAVLRALADEAAPGNVR
ncbi:MAG TPA: AcvB/VirJ family lysyl-phosphatidylglycerol hydrolase [Longimicrobium sp.]|uniref:AcvB/VirJ family lysyl-phosphatidylglycerol hydrolase n=1 Tax=Longimicrobium sp. TaxID=2029185 RepID=UPI002EDAED30